MDFFLFFSFVITKGHGEGLKGGLKIGQNGNLKPLYILRLVVKCGLFYT